MGDDTAPNANSIQYMIGLNTDSMRSAEGVELKCLRRTAVKIAAIDANTSTAHKNQTATTSTLDKFD